MSPAAPVALVLGTGPNIGSAVIRHFLKNGYQVASVSRKDKDDSSTDKNRVHFTADLADSNAIAEVFEKTKAAFGPPHVVVYNAAKAVFTPADDPFALTADRLSQDFAVNTVGAFSAAQEAVKAWSQMPEQASKTFIYTGNALNKINLPALVSLGIGKAASAHFIENAATAYASKGHKFYYCDERKPDGAVAGSGIDGDAHAELYVSLARSESQLDWLQTFVKGIGYKKFEK